MFIPNPTPAAQIVAAGVTVVKTAKKMMIVHRTETAKRRAIELNRELDIEAIRRAGAVVEQRIQSGYYGKNASLATIVADQQNEFEFQKIAVRQEL